MVSVPGRKRYIYQYSREYPVKQALPIHTGILTSARVFWDSVCLWGYGWHYNPGNTACFKSRRYLYHSTEYKTQHRYFWWQRFSEYHCACFHLFTRSVPQNRRNLPDLSHRRGCWYPLSDRRSLYRIPWTSEVLFFLFKFDSDDAMGEAFALSRA